MTHFLIHYKTDTVGVAVVDIKSGDQVRGRYLDSDDEIEIKAIMDIPLGHKIALQDAAVGDTTLKYGHDVGRVAVDIKAGEHVHVHNLKTKRW